MVKVGIIGGTGVYDPGLLEDAKQIKVHTPFGKPSDLITTGVYKDVEMAVIPRHGNKHTINPSDVNYRANIWALKELGITHILASSAVGSLKEEIKPGDIVFTNQFIDRTHKRKTTFFEGSKVCHISVAEPFCGSLRKLLISEAQNSGFNFHEKGVCVVIEGPRFSTKAESNVFRSWNADLVGMTLVPEVVLAREAELCYASIATVTDYDCWRETHCNIEDIIKVMKENTNKVKSLITSAIPKIKEENCGCREALKTALI